MATAGDDEEVVITAVRKRRTVIELLDSDSDDDVVFVAKPPPPKKKKKPPPKAPGELRRPRRAVECPICFCEAAPEEAVRVIRCRHTFCEECLATYVQGKAGEGSVPCPALKDDKKCGEALADHEVRLLLKDDEQIRRYERLALQKVVETADDLSCCPTAGCEYLFAYDEDNRKLDCPLCHKTFCLVCKTSPWHTGQKCEEWQARNGDGSKEDKAFGSYLQKHKLKQCPRCKRWIEKTFGCDAMHCRCNLVFCYKCGGVTRQFRENSAIPECRCAGVAALLATHENSSVNHNNPGVPPAPPGFLGGLFGGFGGGGGF